jgi:putative flippase GtrA
MDNNKKSNLIRKLFIEKTDDVKIQFFRYLFVGGFAAVVNIGSLYLFKEYLHFYYLLANIVGFTLGLITNYILSKWLVFAKEESMNGIVEFIIYVIIGILGLGLDTLFIWLFTDKLKLYYMISKIISTGLVFIWNFLARKGMYVIANKLRKEK